MEMTNISNLEDKIDKNFEFLSGMHWIATIKYSKRTNGMTGC